MSQENVELVERVLRESHEGLDALLEIVDDDACWESGLHDLPDGADTYCGPAGVTEFFRRWLGAFDGWGYEADELIDVGDSVVFHMRQWGQGKGSAVPVTDEFWQVWTIRDGKLIHRTRHTDKSAALEAVGLSE